MGKAELNAELRARCSASLSAALKLAAEKEEAKPSELIRRYVQAGLKGRLENGGPGADITPLVRELTNLSLDLGRVGGNLNQISHYFNIHDTLNEGELARNHRALYGHFQEIAKYLKKLRRELI